MSRASQKRPPASAAGDTHTQTHRVHTRVKYTSRLHERGVLDRAQGTIVSDLPGSNILLLLLLLLLLPALSLAPGTSALFLATPTLGTQVHRRRVGTP